MTTSGDRAAPPPGRRPVIARRAISSALALGVAFTAGGALLLVPAPERTPPPARLAAATAWPAAQRADIPAKLSDGAGYDPLLFLDARTSVGTAARPDGGSLRLVLRNADGSVRELRRLPRNDNPIFETVAPAGNEIAWMEVSGRETFGLWAVDPRGNAPARRLTADTGDAVAFASQYDLVFAAGRLHWIAAGSDDGKGTEIRSVALSGGPVEVRTRPGAWALSAWPWLVNGVDGAAGTTLLHNLTDGRQITVPATSVQTTTCSPAWCRAVVASGDGTARIDLMHPDGSARRRVAGGAATPAIKDVAALDRFEILTEPGSGAGFTNTARLFAYDLTTERTVDLGADISNASYRHGVLWWSTGQREAVWWHSIDLRTV